MKTNYYHKWVIGLFCMPLALGGICTVLPNTTNVGKTVVKSMRQHVTNSTTVLGKVTELTEGLVEGVENSLETYIYQKESYIDWYGWAENALGRDYIRDSDPSYTIVKDNHSILQFITFKADYKAIIEQVIKLNQTLEESNIPLMFVQAPSKVIEGFTELPPSVVDLSNENINTFLDALTEGGINCMDLRSYVEEDGLDKEILFYKTDHHWTTETALWATEKIIDRVRIDYGIDLDEGSKYINADQFQMTTYEGVFLGSQGRRVGRYYAGVDDFTLITPKFETDYQVTINKSDSSNTYEGNFEEAILHDDLLDMMDTVYTNRYAGYFGADYPEVIVENKLNTNGKKVLIIKDSFALPVSAYLSTAVEELRMLDIRYTTIEDIGTYAKEYKPDVVIFVCKSVKPMA